MRYRALPKAMVGRCGKIAPKSLSHEDAGPAGREGMREAATEDQQVPAAHRWPPGVPQGKIILTAHGGAKRDDVSRWLAGWFAALAHCARLGCEHLRPSRHDRRADPSASSFLGDFAFVPETVASVLPCGDPDFSLNLLTHASPGENTRSYRREDFAAFSDDRWLVRTLAGDFLPLAGRSSCSSDSTASPS